MAKNQKCYKCENLATSREHIPPKCLFPEAKDSPRGVDYRRNLITVPSCDEDNSAKSKDDEYLCLVIVTSFNNNLAAQRQFSKKGIRALKARSSLHSIFSTRFPARVDGKETVAFTVDKDRFDDAIGCIASGLCFHHFEVRYTANWHVDSPQMFVTQGTQGQVDTEIMEKQNRLTASVTRRLVGVPEQGSNPEIFSYQLLPDQTEKATLVRMVFYKGMEVIAVMPNTSISQ